MRGTQGLPTCLPTPIDMLKAHYEVKLAALKAHTDALANAADDALDPTCGCDACVLLREVVAEYRAWEADNGAR